MKKRKQNREIKKGKRKYQQQSGHKAHGKEDDLHVWDQFFVVRELVGLQQVEDQEDDRYDAVVDTVF